MRDTRETQWQADCLHWHGRVLTGAHRHWCPDWDGLPVDESCPEFECCTCKPDAQPLV